MALQTQLLPLILSQGLDTKTDPKAVPLGRLTILENGVFTSPGRINKRHGYRVLGKTIETTGATIASGVGLTNFGNELLLADGSRLYSYSEATGNWIDRGSLVPMRVATTSVMRDSHTQSDPDSTINRNVRLTVWVDSRGGLRYSAQDATTNAFFVQDAALDTVVDGGTNTYARAPRVLSFGANFVVIFAKASKLWYRLIPAARPTTIGAAINFVASLVVNGPYDALVIGSRLFVAWEDSTGPLARVSYFDSAFSFASSVSVGHAATSTIGLCSSDRQECVVMIASASVAANPALVQAQVFSYALVAIGSLVTLESIAPTSDLRQITGIILPGSRTLTVYYETVIQATSDTTIRTNTYAIDTNTLGTASVFIRSAGILSRAFLNGSRSYMAVSYASRLQATFFLLDASSAVVAKIHPHTAGGPRAVSSQPTVTALALAGAYELPCTQQTQIIAQGGNISALRGVTIATLTFTTIGQESARQNNNLLLAGGLVQTYDGVSLVESGFHLFPESVTASQTVPVVILVTVSGDGTHPETTTFTFAGTGRIAPAQFFNIHSTTTNYFVWFTVDGNGTIPTPSTGGTGIAVAINSFDPPATVASKIATAIAGGTSGQIGAAAVGAVVTTTNASNGAVAHANNPVPPPDFGLGTGSAAGAVQYSVTYEWTDNAGQIVKSVPSVPLSVTVGATGSVTLQISTLRITARDGTRRAPARVVIYRTQDAGIIPYRITSVSMPILNDVTTDWMYYADTASDASIAGNDLLYTFGGLLENDPPPSADSIVTFKNRMILSGGEDRNTISVSLQSGVGDPVRFSDNLAIPVDQRGGEITALGVLDDKLIVFKRHMIFALDGEGPNNAGQGGTFSVPALIATDVGCANPRSVVLVEKGLMFQSAAGFYLLDRSLQVTYIGAAVERYNGLTVTGAQFVPGSFHVRFTTTDDTTLVYDMVSEHWATFTNHASVGCTVANDVFSFARADGTVWREDNTSFVDGNGQLIRLRLETGWISMAGVQGFQRARRLLVLGDYKGPHQLIMQIATDYSPAFAQYETADAAPLVGASVYGSSSPYGAGTVYGGDYVPYQFRVHLVNQKCEAIRIRIEDSQASAYNEGYAINALTLEVGVKRGPMKVTAARSF